MVSDLVQIDLTENVLRAGGLDFVIPSQVSEIEKFEVPNPH